MLYSTSERGIRPFQTFWLEKLKWTSQSWGARLVPGAVGLCFNHYALAPQLFLPNLPALLWVRRKNVSICKNIQFPAICFHSNNILLGFSWGTNHIAPSPTSPPFHRIAEIIGTKFSSILHYFYASWCNYN